MNTASLHIFGATLGAFFAGLALGTDMYAVMSAQLLICGMNIYFFTKSLKRINK